MEEIRDVIETAESTTGLDELAQVCERRSLTYRLLSRLFRVEVDEGFLSELRGMRFPAATGNDQVDEGYRLIATYVGRAQGDALTELAADYVRTFIGAGIDGHAAAYPYESVYTSKKRLLMEEARNEVLAVYRSLGLESAADWKEPEDHAALEFELMAVACERCAEALRTGDEERASALLHVQANFLSDHLARWVSPLAHDMGHFAKTGLYQGTALLATGFVAEDAAFLNELEAEE